MNSCLVNGHPTNRLVAEQGHIFLEPEALALPQALPRHHELLQEQIPRSRRGRRRRRALAAGSSGSAAAAFAGTQAAEAGYVACLVSRSDVL